MIKGLRLTGILAVVVLLTAGCAGDDEQDGQRADVTVRLCSTSFLEVKPMDYHRAMPTGYVAFKDLYPTSAPAYSSIGLMLTPNQTSVSGNSIRYNNGEWTGKLDLITGRLYYLYGFMPSEEAERATVVAHDGDFSNGVTLRIESLNTLTNADVCVVVGVKNSETDEDIEDVGIRLGDFSFMGGIHNYVYLLMEHLYAGLHFKAHVDTKYAGLRTIVIKEMTLTTTEAIATKINLSVSLRANNRNEDPLVDIDYDDVLSTSEQAKITLFPIVDDPLERTEFVVPVETVEDFLGCFAPGKCKSFELYTKYDVYDKNVTPEHPKGNLIRKDCEAYNQINASHLTGFDYLRAGEIYTIDLKIQPTYLYVLSEPDLDNPTITIQ